MTPSSRSHSLIGVLSYWLLFQALGCIPFLCKAESYEEYVARHKRVQKMMNPMNVPVANVMNDAWDKNPEYANPKDKPAPKKGPAVFYIKSSRDGCGRLTYPFGNR
ncbi:hypothetical protein EBT23_03495 [bacterium]|nr:hypothetical protein [bacterium]